MTPVSRKLRRGRTDAELRLWSRLRNRQIEGAKFRQQHAIGGYVADLVCEEARLVIELDGGQHSLEVDANRTRSIEADGYTVLRFWNHDVMQNCDGVREEIRRMLRIAIGAPL